MIDDIFRLRFIEEVSKIANAKDKSTQRKLRGFAILSFILALGSTIGTVELIIDAVKSPETTFYVHYIVIFILFGFSATFLLTLLIFVIAYSRNIVIRKCLSGLVCTIDKEEVRIGDEICVDVNFLLKKRSLKEVRLVLTCQKETALKVLDIASVKKEIPFKKEVILFKEIEPDRKYDYKLKLKIPQDALSTQVKLTDDKERVTWGITIYFDFVNWHSYEEKRSLTVI